MIHLTVDGRDAGPGYLLTAIGKEPHAPGRETALCSDPLIDARSIALQARELVDAAAALIEALPEYALAFERLHDVIDSLPTA